MDSVDGLVPDGIIPLLDIKLTCHKSLSSANRQKETLEIVTEVVDIAYKNYIKETKLHPQGTKSQGSLQVLLVSILRHYPI